MAKRFEDKVVIVTGSSSGIGQDAAIEYAKEGASVVIHGQNESRLNATESTILKNGIPAERILKVVGSMEDSDTPKKIIAATVEKFGKIDVNNAGTMKHPEIENSHDLENLDFIFKDFECGGVDSARLSILGKNKRKRAEHQQHLRSESIQHRELLLFNEGSFGPFHSLLRPDLWTQRPGPIESIIFERNYHEAEKLEKVNKWWANNTLLNRFGTLAETTSVIKFITSHEASNVTGVSWLVDGGANVKITELNLK